MALSVATQVMELAAFDEMQRLQRYRRAWDAYYGRLPRPLRVRPGQPDDNVVVNYARLIVDKGVAFLFGGDVRFELSETERTAAEEWLRACWQQNRQATLLQKLALNGAVCGHAFLKIVPQPGAMPRLVVLDPATVRVTWDMHDLERVVRYRIQYPAIDPATGRPVTVRQDIENAGAGWRIRDQLSRGDATQWQTVGETIWPYPWPPIVDCQNVPVPNEYWGLSDLEDDVIQLNQSINFVLSNIARIIRFHAHPKTWGRGFTASQLNIAVDETIVLPAPDAELRNLEMVSDLSSSIALYERLREALHEVSRVPEVATGKLDRAGALSGVALAILYQPLIEKTESKRRTYGEMLVELNRRLLALGGFGDDLRTTIHWPELLPGEPLVERQVALIDQQLGVSRDTLLQRLGYEPDVEAEKAQLERDEQAEADARDYARGGLGGNGRAL